MPRRAIVSVLLVLAIISLGVAGWLGWQAWRVQAELRAAVSQASALQSALERGDEPAADAALKSLQDHSAAADERTSGRSWSVLTHLPGLGDDARGLRVVSSVVSDLTHGGLEPLLHRSDRLDEMVPRDGQVSLSGLRSLRGPVATATEALAEADAALSGEETEGYAESLRSNYRDLAGQVAAAHDDLAAAEKALEILPTMLGAKGERTYLLVFQNNAEIRATGGLPGAVSVLKATDGRIRMTRQVPAASFGRRSSSVLPLSRAERKIYGTQLGTYFLDANFTPDYSRASDLWRSRWEEVFNDRIDGVLSIDAVAISYLLRATGPVEVDGVNLDAGNAVDELLHQVYLRVSEPEEQDAFFREVARSVFDRASQGVAEPELLLQALARSGGEGRLLVHSYRQREQRILSGTPVAGEFRSKGDSDPSLNVTFNDGTGSKMSYFLRYEVRASATYCNGGEQEISGQAAVSSIAPMESGSLPDTVTGGGVYGVKPGTQLVTMRIYGPPRGKLESLTLNGRRLSRSTDQHGSRAVATLYVFLRPQQSVDVNWKFTAPSATDHELDVTPPITPTDSDSIIKTACG